MGYVVKAISIEGNAIDIVRSNCLHDPDSDSSPHMCCHGSGGNWIKLDGVWLNTDERSSMKAVSILESLGTLNEIRKYLLPLNEPYDPST